MQRLEVSGAVRSIYGSLGFKRLTSHWKRKVTQRHIKNKINFFKFKNSQRRSCGTSHSVKISYSDRSEYAAATSKAHVTAARHCVSSHFTCPS